MRNFGTYFTGTCVFLLVPRKNAFLHDSVRYQNIRSRDPTTLLSMDIVVETFLEIGVSDLLVLTWHLQDPLYLELWETYLSLSIGLGKQNFMLSHDISLIMSVVEWLTLRITLLCLLLGDVSCPAFEFISILVLRCLDLVFKWIHLLYFVTSFSRLFWYCLVCRKR